MQVLRGLQRIFRYLTVKLPIFSSYYTSIPKADNTPSDRVFVIFSGAVMFFLSLFEYTKYRCEVNNPDFDSSEKVKAGKQRFYA